MDRQIIRWLIVEQPVIPVRNIYYMLTYAWGYLQEIKQADLEAIPGNNLLDIWGMY